MRSQQDGLAAKQVDTPQAVLGVTDEGQPRWPTEGVALTEVRDLLGHSTVQMTERYAHLAPENVRAAVARLEEVSHILVTPTIRTSQQRR